jgi:hypothetical protein
MPEPGVLFAGILFSTIGLAAFLYGKKQAKWAPMVFGAALVLITFAIPDTTLLYLAGIGLCAALFWFRD